MPATTLARHPTFLARALRSRRRRNSDATVPALVAASLPDYRGAADGDITMSTPRLIAGAIWIAMLCGRGVFRRIG